LPLGAAEDETVASSELCWSGRGALELIDHLALGDRDRRDLDREAQLLGREAHRHLAVTDLAGERMIPPVAPLGGVAHRQEKALVPARQVLQAHVSTGRERQRL